MNFLDPSHAVLLQIQGSIVASSPQMSRICWPKDKLLQVQAKSPQPSVLHWKFLVRTGELQVPHNIFKSLANFALYDWIKLLT